MCRIKFGLISILLILFIDQSFTTPLLNGILYEDDENSISSWNTDDPLEKIFTQVAQLNAQIQSLNFKLDRFSARSRRDLLVQRTDFKQMIFSFYEKFEKQNNKFDQIMESKQNELNDGVKDLLDEYSKKLQLLSKQSLKRADIRTEYEQITESPAPELVFGRSSVSFEDSEELYASNEDYELLKDTSTSKQPPKMSESNEDIDDAYAINIDDALLDDNTRKFEESSTVSSDIDNQDELEGSGSDDEIRITVDAVDINTSVSVEDDLPTSCAEALKLGGKSGIYNIRIADSDLMPFKVYCLEDPNGGDAWTIIQRRQDGSVDFYRDWNEYKKGFGNLNSEYFIGLERLHALTYAQPQELWIQMEDFEDNRKFAKYTDFVIGDEQSKYEMEKLGDFDGNVGDSLRLHAGHKFTTKDNINDNGNNCAQAFKGAWWYEGCHHSNLNGLYRNQLDKYSPGMEQFARGIVWWTWHGYQYTMKYVHMAIRAK